MPNDGSIYGPERGLAKKNRSPRDLAFLVLDEEVSTSSAYVLTERT
jgi:hypothetical protein